MSCDVGHRRGSDPTLLWPRLAATSSNWTPSLGTSICYGCGPEKTKKKTKKKKKKERKRKKKENISRCVTSKEIEPIIQNLSKKSPGLDGFTSKFHRTFKESIVSVSSLLKNYPSFNCKNILSSLPSCIPIPRILFSHFSPSRPFTSLNN